MVIGTRVSLDVSDKTPSERVVIPRLNLRIPEIEALDLAQRAVQRLARRETVRSLEIDALPIGVVVRHALVADTRFALQCQGAAKPREREESEASLHVFTSRRTRARSSSGSKGLTR